MRELVEAFRGKGLREVQSGLLNVLCWDSCA